MQFIKRLWSKLYTKQRKTGYTLDFKDALLARFVFDKRHLKSDGTVHANAFLPQTKYPEELSVYEIKSLGPQTIWALAQYVRKDKPVLARADFCWPLANDKGAELLKRLELKHDSKPDEHERHCNINGFPGNKEQNKLVALELSQLAELIKHV